MRIEHQFEASLENKPGRLLNVCTALAKEKVSLLALTVVDGKRRSVLRFVADKVPETRAAMKILSIPVTESDVVAVELKHQPGALAHLCECLAAEHVNIDYIYCSAGTKNGKTVAILKASPLDKVRAVLTESVPNRKRGPMRRPPVRK